MLRVALPGPLQLSSHHTLELVAGAMRVRAAFQVVPPLNAEINLHLYRLQIDAQPRVAATIQFSRAVASRQQAQTRVTVSGQPTFTWRDSRTLDVVSTGFKLSDRATVTIDPGVDAADGTKSRSQQRAEVSAGVGSGDECDWALTV